MRKMTPQQLKNSILQMAMQGKLVEQRPEEGTGEELYQQIQAEKKKLIKEGKIKKSKKLPEITEEEIPFEIPESWKWARLIDIVTKLVDGDHNPPKGELNPTKYIMASSRNINNDQLIDMKNVRYLSKEKFEKANERTHAEKNDIFFTSVGSLGRSCVYLGGMNICFQRSVTVIKTLIFPYYLKYYFDSPVLQNKLVSEASGTAQKGFYLKQLKFVLVPIPPLDEQKRIVAKLEEIQPLLDRYEKAYNRLEAYNQTFPENLKKSILQYAIEGKLVEQRPEEGTGEALYQEIQAEKKKLIQAGKIKKSKKLPEITEEEIPFEIPENWKWVRLGEIIEFFIGKTPKRHEVKYWQKSDFPWVSISDLVDGGHINKTKEQISNKAAEEIFKNRIVPKGTLLMSFKLTIGKVSILDIDAFHNEAIISIFPIIDKENIFRNYLFIFLPAISSGGKVKTAIKGKTLNSNSLKNLLVPVPPLSEQKRIVAKIEELMAMVEALEEEK